MTAGGDAVLNFAYGEVGTQSGDKYWDWYGADLGSYCACFVSYCGWHTGFPVCPIDSSLGFVLVSNGTIHSYENGEAKPTLDLQPGDVILFSWYGWAWVDGMPVIVEDPWVGWIAGDHTGIFSHWIDQGSGQFATVEGNTMGGVVAYREDRYTSQVCGWWRPPSIDNGWSPEPPPEETEDFLSALSDQEQRDLFARVNDVFWMVGNMQAIPGTEANAIGSRVQRIEAETVPGMGGTMAGQVQAIYWMVGNLTPSAENESSAISARVQDIQRMVSELHEAMQESQ